MVNMLYIALTSSRNGLRSNNRISLPSSHRLYFLGILALFFVLVPTSGAELDFCLRGGCFCTATKATCENINLGIFPRNFNQRLTELTIKNADFVYPVLMPQNVSYLVSVNQLIIKNCGITKILSSTFSNLRELRLLDLSGNKLTLIPGYTFSGSIFNFLILSHNPGISFSTQAFKGLKVKRLVLSNCGIRSLNYKVFSHINESLIGLWLEKNHITTMDPLFENLFSHLKTFEISNNPLNCGCEIRWLVSHLQRVYNERKRKSGMMLSSYVPPKCSTPSSVHNRLVRSLEPHEIVCTPPQMRTVEIYMKEYYKRRGKLSCQVEGYPTPSITWIRLFPEKRILQTFRPREYHLTSDGRYENRATVTVHGVEAHEEYACIAHNSGGRSNVTVKLTWPKDQGAKSKTGTEIPPKNRGTDIRKPDDMRGIDSTSPRETGNNRRTGGSDLRNNQQFNMPDEVTEQNYFFRKQFTLLELIGAVVGTFTGTLALFVLIYRFISCTKKKEKKRTFSQYMYESAYSGSHEYDVPRIDHPGPPYGPPPKPPGADGMEFLDYKTHRKLYNHV